MSWSHRDPVKGYGVCNTCGRRIDYQPIDCGEVHHSDYWNHNRPAKLEKKRLWSRSFINNISLETLRHYGGRCSCCSFGDLERKSQGRRILELDHVNGGGHKEATQTGIHGWRFFVLLKKRGFPPGLRVLCRPCNSIIEPGAEKCFIHATTK